MGSVPTRGMRHREVDWRNCPATPLKREYMLGIANGWFPGLAEKKIAEIAQCAMDWVKVIEGEVEEGEFDREKVLGRLALLRDFATDDRVPTAVRHWMLTHIQHTEELISQA